MNNLPNSMKFFDVIGALIEKLSVNDQPVRTYGEMVALLWQSGNKEAVISLENLWNELIEKYSFSLYCAYPELHFIMDSEAKTEITHTHNIQYPMLAT